MMPIIDIEKRKAYTKTRYDKLMQDNPNHAKEESAKWRAANPERAREIEANYRSKNKDKIKLRHSQPNERFSRAKSKAKKANREFTLTLEEYTILCQQACHYCNGAMGEISPTGSGLDRIDSNKGYSVDNVVTCCMNCNTMKSNILSYKEMTTIMPIIIAIRAKDKNDNQI